MTPTRAVYLVARREVVTRVRTRSFLWGTLGMLLAILGYLAFTTYLADDDPLAVGLAPQQAELRASLTTAVPGEQLDVRVVPERAAAEAALAEDSLTAWVTGSPGALEVLVSGEVPAELRRALDTVAAQQVVDERLAAAGLDPAQVARQANAAAVQVTNLDPVDPQREQRLLLSLAGMVLLYFALVVYGSYVAQGVVEEKSTRVVEVLLAAVRPWQLMAGKLLGIGVFGLVQLAVLSAAALVAVSVTGVLTVPPWGALAVLLGWYLLGYFLFAALFAGAGALVSRQEEVQSVISPVLALLIAPFLLGVSLLTENPESTLVTTLSMVPPFAPILMPARMVIDVAPWWQVAVAATATVAAIAVVVALAARVYSRTVLRTGARVRLADTLRST